MSYAILKITDGTTEVNLIGPQAGFHLTRWRPQVLDYKGGGVWQDSPLANFRRIVDKKYDTVVDTFDIKARDIDQDTLIRDQQNLLRLLEKASTYPGVTDWQDTPVYLEAQASCETNSRYTLIQRARIPELENPYAQPFQQAGGGAVMDNLTLLVEHGAWLANVPGESTCTISNTLQTWSYRPAWADIGNGGGSPTQFGDAMIQLANGRVIYASSTNTRRSDDNGATWAVTAMPNNIQPMNYAQTPNGDVYAIGEDAVGGNSRVARSVNNGTAFTTVDTIAVAGGNRGGAIVATTAGTILAAHQEQGGVIRRSTNGTVWATAYTLPGTYNLQAGLQLANGWVIFVGDLLVSPSFTTFFRSQDDGLTWDSYTTPNIGGAPRAIYQHSSGNVFVGGSGTSAIVLSIDNTLTWDPIFAGINAWDITEDTTGVLYIPDMTNGGDMYYSEDDGYTWTAVDPGSAWPTLTLGLANGSVININNQAANYDCYSFSYGDAAIEFGVTNSSCDDSTYIANKHNQANLTHIFVDDGGVFGANLIPMTAFPVSLLPAVPAVNDACYFIIEGAAGSLRPFGSLVFDLSQVASATTSYTILWEYWNGAWVAATTRDNTAQLSTLGIASVQWEPPTDWAVTTVNGITGMAIRARLSALVGVLQPPQQSNNDVYTILVPFLEIADTVVQGDIPALCQLRTTNQSDEDGRGGSAPDLWVNRLFVGLRSTSRGTTYSPYINISDADEQNPTGVTVAVVAPNTTFADDADRITGRIFTWAAQIAQTTFADRAAISFTQEIITQYYGAFRALLRGQVTTGNANDITVRIQIRTGSGGVTLTSKEVAFQTTTDYELLDLGRVNIPASGLLSSTELGDASQIAIQAKNDSGATRTVYFHDLILMPVDEWSIDAVDKANTSDSIVGRQSDIPHLLEVDSVSFAKRNVRALVRTTGESLFVSSIYEPITPNEAILQANAEQRLWFFGARTSATGTSFSWIAEPWIAHTVNVWHNARYMGMRGAR